jgi:hypothetical protein
MRSLINAMNSIVVNGQVDRTNVAGIGSLRGSDLLLRSRLYAACALRACAYLCGIQSRKHAHHASAIEQMCLIATGAPCWRPEQPFTGSLAFACTT